MDIGDELRTAGLTVITGTPGIGHKAESLVTKITGTGVARGGAQDLNEIVTPARGVVYVERDGRVWLLADGPVAEDVEAMIWVAAYRVEDITDKQHDTLAVVEAVLSAAYGIDGPEPRSGVANAGDDEITPDAANVGGKRK